MAKFTEIKIPEWIKDTDKWLSDREVMEIVYENYDPKLLEQIDKEDKKNGRR